MKSHESTLLEIARCVLDDAMAMCSVQESAQRDFVTLKSRVRDEGISFLTITLPNFGSDFERCLDQGRIDPKYFRSFRKYRQIPVFLRGIVGLVFDADTGGILENPPTQAIEAVRQIAYTFKKLKLDCAAQRVHKTFIGYVQDEHDLSEDIPDEQRDQFIAVSNLLWNWMRWDPLLGPNAFIPKHGPGATAERIYGNHKYRFSSWYDCLEPYFPLTQFAIGSLNAIETEEFDKLTVVPKGSELPVRVITVPKTLKAPRIIAIEPVCMQYTQQALSRNLMKALERRYVTSGHVNFTDQSVNQRLAIMSSQTGKLATLDLSSASDRVHASLVYDMLSANPDFRDAVFACRSKTAQLPSGEILTLKKFASMGSALCFPIESMYFYTICIAARLSKHNLPVTTQNILVMSRDVYVYGDDIIVPVDDTDAVVDHLHKYHCKVNMSKSFWTGKFRESCGMDAYNGKQVTPVYLRCLPPNDRRSASEIVSWVESARLLQKKGMLLTSNFLYEKVETIIGKLPMIHDTSAGLGRLPVSNLTTIDRWNSHLQVPEVWAWTVRAVRRDDELDGYPALLKCLLLLEEKTIGGVKTPLCETSSVSEDHLSKTVRPGAVALQRQWILPY